ncbi:hypothetical protein JXA40_02860 [bacterium]|nr:hypothetical protein [candidate division CSSED10-310 bacterium]
MMDSIPEDFRDITRIMSKVDQALLQNDVRTVIMILQDVERGLDEETLTVLRRSIASAVEKFNRFNEIYTEGSKAIAMGDPDRAITCFQTVLAQIPDHAGSRIGIQTATRIRDLREQVDALLSRAREARNREDFLTAQELCKTILSLAPEDEYVKDLDRDVSTRLKKQRQIMRVLREGDQCFDEERYEDAILIWENIESNDSGEGSAMERIERARSRIRDRENRLTEKNRITEAQRALDGGRYQTVIDLIGDFPENSEYRIDAELCLRKARDGIEGERTIRDLETQIRSQLEKGDPTGAKQLIDMLIQLNPQSPLIDEFKKHGAP